MWLNEKQIGDAAIFQYRRLIRKSSPKHIVIDGLFNQTKLDEVVTVLQQSACWQTQKHTYSGLYVDDQQWQQANKEQRFVQRDVWLRNAPSANTSSTNNTNYLNANIAHDFLAYLRGNEFMPVLSRIFNVTLTDMNVADPAINTNYFRLGPNDFVAEHADDSPGREVCMLLYLNQEWDAHAGGELIFAGKNAQQISIPPLHNRCVLFDPSTEGSEHWVNSLNTKYADRFRYNVTSWYWSK